MVIWLSFKDKLIREWSTVTIRKNSGLKRHIPKAGTRQLITKKTQIQVEPDHWLIARSKIEEKSLMLISLCCRVIWIRVRDLAPGHFMTETHKNTTLFLHTMKDKAGNHLTIINKQSKKLKDKESRVEISNSWFQWMGMRLGQRQTMVNATILWLKINNKRK